MCVFGTRPEAVKLAPVVHALKESAELEPVVAITAQHREMLDQMMKWFDVKADYDLDLMKHGQTLAELTSRVVLGMDDLLSRDRPDMLLVQGDTVTVMAASLAAFYHKIPVGHVEAGLRTNDRYNPFPEEMSRRQTGRIATMHFAPTDLAVKNLAAEGITENVFMTGNTVIDALLDTAGRLSEETIDKQLFGAADFDRYKVLLVTAHRRENWGQGMDEIALALRHIAEEFPDVQVLYPIHRNPVVRQSIEPVFAGHDRLLLVEPLDYVPFVYAMRRCHFILTDSGGVQEEAPALGKPVLVMRTNTERPEAVSAGAAQLVGVSQETICDGARQLMTSPQRYKAMSSAVNPFGDGQAAKRIVQEVEKFLRSP
ncbi:MAG TPA: UDP-N-acetylglucosamine 2-epimerase (non-hydrolyzing) [Candidatus Obscuribacter sp.]|nr:UDP-N-acetylglucosamine 2-epimerase (non-hydrolyzing) [Candidatus Obscuribacter sp.]HNG18224.1 UDP-N-acetylglucosamine 2-epimerase (non-hydrolyzing) [Candidatus Obscuribacter sp.]